MLSLPPSLINYFIRKGAIRLSIFLFKWSGSRQLLFNTNHSNVSINSSKDKLHHCIVKLFLEDTRQIRFKSLFVQFIVGLSDHSVSPTHLSPLLCKSLQSISLIFFVLFLSQISSETHCEWISNFFALALGSKTKWS